MDGYGNIRGQQSKDESMQGKIWVEDKHTLLKGENKMGKRSISKKCLLDLQLLLELTRGGRLLHNPEARSAEACSTGTLDSLIHVGAKLKSKGSWIESLHWVGNLKKKALPQMLPSGHLWYCKKSYDRTSRTARSIMSLSVINFYDPREVYFCLLHPFTHLNKNC